MTRTHASRLAALLALLTLVAVFVFVVPFDVLAQSSDTLSEVGDATGLGSEDPRVVVARIIRTTLTFLGVLAVLICLYGGFVWMTAGGSAEKVEKAKKVLIRGAIGLGIILLSWAITTFIITALLSATGTGGSGGTGGAGGSGGTLGGGSTSSFTVTDYSPDSAVAIRNVQLRVTFSRNLDDTTVDGNIVVTNAATGAVVDGAIGVSGNYATFTPSAACPSPNEDRFCFDADTTFTVIVSDAIESATGTALVCSGDRCASSFATGSLVDTEDPDVTVTDPESGDGIPTDYTQTVQASATDDSEVASAEFALDDVAWDSVGATGDDLSNVTIETTLDTSDLENGERYRITVTATDIAGNTGDDSISVNGRPAWCFNETLDSDLGETGVDCGGDSASATYCGACDGSSCTEDSECSSGSCVDGVCTTLPEIEDISPTSGAVGTYVTVSGTGFGTLTGEVAFTADGGGTVTADIPSCGDGWTSTEVIVEVPDGAADGPITITTSDGDSDGTNDDEGALIDDFDVNDVVHPKLCNITPDDGASTDAVTADGFDFGDTQGDATVTFGSDAAGSYTSWADTSLAVTVPSLADDDYGVVVTVDGVESNAITFSVAASEGEAPTITGIDPDDGAVGDYITISGTNFGTSIGTVRIVSDESGTIALASTDFPDACSDDFWSDDEITVIVPETFQNDDSITAGDYVVYVTTADGADSNEEAFTVTDGDPSPGICALTPDTGEAGDTVVISGERLGTTEGTVAFYNGVTATVAEDGWSSDEITVTVPSGTATGPVTVTSAALADSNTLDFAVGTATTESEEDVAAASYGWYFSTGEIPATPELIVECSDTTVSGVPNARFTDEVCVNAIVYGEFTVVMDEGSVSDAITVEECTSDGDQPCDTTSSVDGALSVSSSSSATTFTFVPTADWTTDTTYQVSVAATASSEDGVALASDVTWTFVTATSDAVCAVESVYVSPSSEIIDTQGGTAAFSALPVSGCVVTNASDYTWDWSVDNSYADFIASSDGSCDGGTTSCATVEGLAEGTTDVTAEETDSNVSGAGELVVNFTDPYVDNYAPNCEEACSDAAVYATFNTAMDEDSVLAEGAVALYTCANELCANLTEFAGYSVECASNTEDDSDRCDEADLILTGALTEETYYRVIVSGDVTSASGVALTRANYHSDFSWTFKVKDGDAVCAVNRLSVTPEAANATAIGERRTFTVEAFGEPDSCSVAGQELTSQDYDWAWTDPIADDGDDAAIAVSEWWASAQVDTDTDGIASGCTTACTVGGSESYGAICGDGTIGTGEECEDGGTVDGDGCSSTCLNEGSSDTCGDGTIGTGEDCDDSNVVDGDGCSSLCLNEGSQEVNAVCGNGDVAYDATVGGEDCDDGNVDRGDGCDALCLNEGAPTLSSIGGAVCGNGTVDEPYENCDTALTTDGCSDTCILEGASALYTTPSTCGDGTIGTGEECDEGDAEDSDGCSSDCILEGSSTTYDTPSFCGDGSAGDGEWDACEASSGDGNVDDLQLAFIGDDAASEVDIDTHSATSTIEVTEPSSGVTTNATYTLSCTAATDLDCPDETTYGVGVSNCCMPRPTADLYPADGATDVCRNALLYGIFTEEMDTSSFVVANDDGTTTPRMYARLDLSTTTDGTCPSDHTTLAMEPRGVFARAWASVRRFFGGTPVSADTGDCVVPIVGFEQAANDDGTYTVRMRYSAALVASADYTLVIDTDADNTDGDADGVLSTGGVGIWNSTGSDEETATFTTGTEICTLDAITVEDTDADSPQYFSQTDEAHTFTATGVSYTTGEAVEIESIDDVYAWEFTAWEDDTDAAIVTAEQSSTASDQATVTASGDNGDANVVATATITADDVGSTEGDTVSGASRVTAYLCENPWPAIADFPWQDDDMNFSTFYCLDTGEDDDTTDDYPEVTVVEAAARPITDDNVIREYLFEVDDSTDAVGVRIVTNEDYLSPAAWYAAQGFTGSPSDASVDGFAAVTDGRTTYVAAANDTGSGIYSNIYVVSYNEGADDETIDIYNQIVENLSFVINIDDTGLCYTSTTTATDTTCASDADCDTDGGEYCADAKAKLTRDTKRLADLTTVATAVSTYGEENGVCSATVDKSCGVDGDCPTGETCEAVVPTLASGTFVRSLGASAWESWNSLLGEVIDIDAGVTDPLNSYNGCGENTLTSYDATTCVDATTGNYVCPDDSYVYHYRAIGNQAIALAADLEYTAGAWVNTLDDDTTDSVTYSAASSGADATVDGFTTDYFCETSTVYGSAGVCGDGVINTESDGTAETCELGERGGTAAACDSDGDEVDDGTREQTCNATCTGWEDDDDAECIPASCGNAVVDTGEDCDDGDNNGRYGYCGSDCTDDERMYCGDGELQGGEACDCGAPSLGAVPTDARPSGGTPGACTGLNGTYDANPSLTCAWDCQGAAAYCGDDTIDDDEGEECDSDTVSWDGMLCKYAGNSPMGVSTFTECTTDDDCESGQQCGDSTPETYSSRFDDCPTTTVCIAGDDGAICEDDTDCDTSSGSGDGICSSVVYATTRTADCANDGASGEMCTASASWQSTDCRATGSCGDGNADAGEECDDGNDTNTDDCTNECLYNVCGDGFLYSDEEQCDEGTDNGGGCDANYASSCTACSVTCTYEASSGDFCGDGDVNGEEYCDAYDIPYAWYSSSASVGVAGSCDRVDDGATWFATYGDFYVDPDTGVIGNPVCQQLGICDGDDDNGDYCTDDGDCDSGDCVFPTCADDCQNACPFTYSDGALLMTSNQPGARSSAAVDLYTYDESTTSDIPNAATITIPACDAISSITADIDISNVTPPETFVLFVTDLSGSMDYIVDANRAATSSEESRLEIVQDGLETAIGELYDELGSAVNIATIGYKAIRTDECYIGGNYCTDDGDCTSYSGDVCPTTDTNTEEYGFVGSSDEDGIIAEVLGYFADNAGHSTLTYEGLEAAEAKMDVALAAYGPDNTRYIIVLLTDGNWQTSDPAATAENIKAQGYELYTAIIQTDETSAGQAFISEGAGWSSGNPDTDTGIDYAYDAQTEDELSDMFDEIINSILNIGVTIISDDNSDSGTDAQSDSDTVRDGTGVALPWPTGFSCNPNSEQELPVRFTFQGEGKIEISNVQIEYCEP